jgi:hypothetical protein
VRNRAYRDDYSNSRTAALAAVISSHPRESVASLVASAAVLTIFINALFLQHGPHPAPIFASAPKAAQVLPPRVAVAPAVAPIQPAPAIAPRIVAPAALPVAEPLPRPRPLAGVTKAAVASETPHNDPIAELLAPGKRVIAIQRALTDFGYGQIKPTGVAGPETQNAIEKFERDHKMPVTGQISDRLAQALAAMTGRSIE